MGRVKEGGKHVVLFPRHTPQSGLPKAQRRAEAAAVPRCGCSRASAERSHSSALLAFQPARGLSTKR